MKPRRCGDAKNRGNSWCSTSVESRARHLTRKRRVPGPCCTCSHRLLPLIILACLFRGSAATGGTQELAYDDVLAAFTAIASMLDTIRTSLHDLSSDVNELKPWWMCSSGLGWFDHTSAWYPWDAAMELSCNAFIPGAAEHCTTGHCLLAPLAPLSSAHETSSVCLTKTDFVSAVALGAQDVLDVLSARFKLKGTAATSLGTAAGLKTVRLWLGPFFLHGSNLAADGLLRNVVFLARAADAFRHLTASRVRDIVQGVEQAASVSTSLMPHDSDASRTSSCCAADVECPQIATPTAVSRAAARIQAQWRGYACRTWLIDLRGPWVSLTTLYRVLARGRVALDLATGTYRALLKGC